MVDIQTSSYLYTLLSRNVTYLLIETGIAVSGTPNQGLFLST